MNRTGVFNLIFLLTWISIFLAGISIMGWSDNYPVVWRYSMFMNAPNSLVIVSAVVIILVCIPLHHRLKFYLIEFLFGFSLLLCFTQIGLIINGALDKSATETFSTTVVSKTISNGARRQNFYNIMVKDWKKPSRTVKFFVTETRYYSTQIEDKIHVETKNGFLGYEWIVNYRQIRFGFP